MSKREKILKGKWLWLILVVVIFLFLGSAMVLAKEATTITLWGWPAADAAFESFLKDFYAKYPDIKMDIKMMPFADVHNKLLTSLAAKAGAPDISMIEINHIDKFVARGGLVNLLDPPFNAGKYREDFVPYKWRQATDPEGRVVALPWDIGPATLFYRRDLFAKAGLPSDPDQLSKVLKTWDDYLEMGKKLTVPGKQWMMNHGQDIFYIYFAHKDFYDEKYNVAVNFPKAVRILEISLKARTMGIDAKVGTWTPEWQAMYKKDALATQISGCWFGGFLKTWIAPEQAGKWAQIPIPEDPGQNWAGSFLSIPEQTKKKADAWKFVEYSMATAEPQNKMYAAVDYLPAYMPAWEDPMYQESDPYFGGQKVRLLHIWVAKNTPIPMTTPMDSLAESILMGHVAQCIDRALDPKKALDDAAAEITKRTRRDMEKIRERLGIK